MKNYILVLMALVLTACTDSAVAKFSAFGDAGNITCYSGGTVIYQGKSTGRIQTEEASDGWYFMESGTNKLIRLSGDCVIKN